jgi:hypothetical protein
MANTTISIQVSGHTYSATAEGGRVEISQDGRFAGRGSYAIGEGIWDCPAVLGGSQDASEVAYEAIADALDEAADEIQAGSWVVCGTGEDADYGTVVSIDGDTAIVSWRGSETRTAASVAGLAVCESREAAREACDAAARQ